MWLTDGFSVTVLVDWGTVCIHVNSHVEGTFTCGKHAEDCSCVGEAHVWMGHSCMLKTYMGLFTCGDAYMSRGHSCV